MRLGARTAKTACENALGPGRDKTRFHFTLNTRSVRFSRMHCVTIPCDARLMTRFGRPGGRAR
jgi:hypothetical protein